MKILLPLDLLQPAGPMVDHLLAVINAANAEFRLLFVNEAWPAYEAVLGSTADFADDLEKQILEKAKTGLKEAEEYLKSRGMSVSSEVVRGTPSLMIESVARDENCQMTVLSPGSHPVVEKFLLGSVSNNLVKHGAGTILIMRPLEHPLEKLSSVLIGVDGSAHCKKALKAAAEQFALKDSNAQVLLLNSANVADPIKFLSPMEFISRVEQNLLLEGEMQLAEAKRYLSELGVKNVEIALKEGSPAERILEVAESIKANLIILGARGLNDVERFLIGSVSQKVAAHAKCAVAVVK